VSSETLPVQCELSEAGVGWACRLHYEATGEWPSMLYYDMRLGDVGIEICESLKTPHGAFRLSCVPEGFWFVGSREYAVFGHHGW
jgi:hypothetical protein